MSLSNNCRQLFCPACTKELVLNTEKFALQCGVDILDCDCGRSSSVVKVADNEVLVNLLEIPSNLTPLTNLISGPSKWISCRHTLERR